MENNVGDKVAVQLALPAAKGATPPQP